MPTTETDPSAAPDWGFVGHYVGRKSLVPDWGALGQYQFIADALMEIARTVIDTAQIKKGEAVLDVGTRTGNWSLLAAEAGAKVTGVDFSPGLLKIAREKLKDYPDARFELADVAKLPFVDASFDAIIDVVSLMFGADREAAIAEMARVLKPDGRIVWTGWAGGDAISEAAKIQIGTATEANGHPPHPYSYWGVEDEMRDLFGAQGLDIQMIKHPIAHTAPSAREFLEGIDQVHPTSRACSLALEKAGIFEQTMEKMIGVLEGRNEDREAFKVSRHFVVGIATRKH